MSPEFMSPIFLSLKAEILMKRKRVEEALEALSEAEALVEKNAEGLFEAEIHRLRGEALLIRGEDQDDFVEACFQQALDVARRQSAKSLELRAVTSVARLWRDQGKHTEAHRELADVYGWFNEGLDSPDLSGARQLLQQLTAGEAGVP
jgi:predicted ATPase